MKTTRAAMLLSLAATSLAHAQSAGQWVVNAGWVHLAPQDLSLIHISEPTRLSLVSRMPSSA